VQSAINSLPRIEERIELTLWQLAYRFGHVSRDGIKLDLPLAHSQLAEMVCAQRPSVSTALTRLRNRGRIAMSRAISGSSSAAHHLSSSAQLKISRASDAAAPAPDDVSG
jgi:hypothetical protein